MNNLDDLLDRSAPQIAPRDETLSRTLTEFAATLEDAAASRVGWRRRVALVTVGSVTAIGIGTAAAGAAGMLPFQDRWGDAPSTRVWDIATPSGTCKTSFAVNGYTRFAGDRAKQAEAVKVAQEYLSKMSLSNIDISKAVAEYGADAPVQDPTADPADVQQATYIGAVASVVDDRVRAEVRANGLDDSGVGTAITGSSCVGPSVGVNGNGDN